MLITERKLRKIIKEIISENDMKYTPGSGPDDAYENEYPKSTEVDDYGNFIPKEEYSGYESFIGTDGKKKYQDKITGEIISSEELMQRIKDKKEIELYNLTRK